MARTRRAVGVKPFKNRQSTALQAKIGSIENKYFDSGIYNVAIAKTLGANNYLDPSTGGLACPIQGDNANNRDGKQIQVTSIEIKGSILFPSAEAIADVALSGQNVMLALVQDKQSDTTAATTTDIYTNIVGSSYNSANILRNPNSIDRFTILKTKTWSRPQCAVTQQAANDFSQTSALIPFHWYVKLKKPVKVRFNTSPGTSVIADIVDNSFHVLAVTGGDDYTVGVNTRMDCTLSYNARSRFYG